MVQVVYFNVVETPSDHEYPIKIDIGYTKDHHERLKQHQKSNKGMVSIVKSLAVIRANRSDESTLHSYFDAHNLKHKRLDIREEEIFLPHAEILDYIRWLRDWYFVWVPDCEERDDIEKIGIEEPDFWMPRPERRKPGPPIKDLWQEFGPLNIPSPETTADDFYTHPSIIEAARRTMGAIDLDPASHPVANSKVKAQVFYSLRDDGLSREWSGRVWVNPPFSEWDSWSAKIIGEWKSGRIQSMCILAATRTITAKYFSIIHENADALCIFRGRIPFWGMRAGSPNDGAIVFYFGKDRNRFKMEFGDLGNVVGPF